MVARHLWTGSVSVESIKRQKEKPDQRLNNLLRALPQHQNGARVAARDNESIFTRELRRSDGSLPVHLFVSAFGYLTKGIAQWLFLAWSMNTCVPPLRNSRHSHATNSSRKQLSSHFKIIVTYI